MKPVDTLLAIAVTGGVLFLGETLALILDRLSMGSKQWLVQLPATESHYWRAVGSAPNLLDHTQRLGRCWLRGIGFARHLLTLSESA